MPNLSNIELTSYDTFLMIMDYLFYFIVIAVIFNILVSMFVLGVVRDYSIIILFVCLLLVCLYIIIFFIYLLIHLC